MHIKESFHHKNNSTESETSDTNKNDYETCTFRKPSTFTPKPIKEPSLHLNTRHLENSMMPAKSRETNQIFPQWKGRALNSFSTYRSTKPKK